MAEKLGKKMVSDSSKDGWLGFLELCSKIHSSEKFQEFFNLFLTFEEKETLASRYLIIKTLLEEELTQRELSEKHKVSIAQITRGSNALKIVSPEFKNFLKTILKKKK